MTYVRFSRTKDPYTGPSILSFRNGSLMLALGQSADLTAEEIDQYDDVVVFDPTSPPGPPSPGVQVVLNWAPGVDVHQNEIRLAPDGTLWRARQDILPTGTTFDTTKWEPLSPNTVFASQIKKDANYVAPDATPHDVSGQSITYTEPSRPYFLEFEAYAVTGTIAGANLNIWLDYNGTQMVTQTVNLRTVGVGEPVPTRRCYIDTPVSGRTVTSKVRTNGGGGSVPTVLYSATSPGRIQAILA